MRWIRLMLAAGIVLSTCRASSAQVVYELYNEQGASAPCVGIGVGVLIVKKCVSAFEKAGFVREKELGFTGLTLGEEGSQDGVVMAVKAGSAAALAGVSVGDSVVRVDEQPTSPTPSQVLAQRGFGERDKELHLKVQRADGDHEITFAHAPKEPPPSPKGEGMMTSERPIINWRGQFAPCIGFGPGAVLAYAFCDKHFAPYGFVSLKEFSSPGFGFDPTKQSAMVSVVDEGSPAARAGLKAGDEVLLLEGKPLTGSTGVNAKMLLFGKTGQVHRVVIRHGGEEKTLSLTLAGKESS